MPRRRRFDGSGSDVPGADLPEADAIEIAYRALERAVADGLTRTRCLRRWSEFIRARDGHRCVDCHGTDRLSAHHISRKSLFEKAQFLTGNGITLCRVCHREAHAGFNGRADRDLPIDSQGGEKLPLMERFYSILLDDAVERGVLEERYYHVSEEVLELFKRMQGYPSERSFPGCSLEQAYLILAETEWSVRDAIAAANGFSFPKTPMLPGGIAVAFEGDDDPASFDIMRRYAPRS